MRWRQLKFIVCRSLLGPVLVPETQLIKRKGVYGVLFNNDRVLLLHNHTNGKLILPGGGVDPGEKNDLDTLRREVREETGLHIVTLVKCVFRGRTFFVYNPTHTPIFEAYDQVSLVYTVTFENSDLLADDQVDDLEAREPRWIPIKEIRPEQFSGPWMWEALQAALKARADTPAH